MPPTDGFSTPPPCLSSSASLPTHHCNITPPVAQIPLRSWAGTLGRGFGSQGHGHIAPWVRACLSSGSTLDGRVGPGYPKVACPFCKSPFPSYPLAPPQPYGFPRPNLFTWLRPPSTWLNSPQIYPIGRLFPTLGPCVNRRSHLSAPSLLWWVLSDPRHATIHEIMIYTPILPQSSGLLFFGLHHSKPFFHNSLSFFSYCQHQPVPFSISFCTTINSTQHHSSQRRHAATTQGIEYISFYLSVSLSQFAPKHPVCRPLRHYSAHFLSRFPLSYFLLSTSPFSFLSLSPKAGSLHPTDPTRPPSFLPSSYISSPSSKWPWVVVATTPLQVPLLKRVEVATTSKAVEGTTAPPSFRVVGATTGNNSSRLLLAAVATTDPPARLSPPTTIVEIVRKYSHLIDPQDSVSIQIHSFDFAGQTALLT